jgi:hypothetical protein
MPNHSAAHTAVGIAAAGLTAAAALTACSSHNEDPLPGHGGPATAKLSPSSAPPAVAPSVRLVWSHTGTIAYDAAVSYVIRGDIT